MKILFHWYDRIKINDKDKAKNQHEMNELLSQFSPCGKQEIKEIHVYYNNSDPLDNAIDGTISCGRNNDVAKFTCGFKGQITLEEITK